MRLLKVLGLGLLAGLGLQGAAHAEGETGFYIRADAGWSFIDWHDGEDSAFVGGGGVGYQFSDWFRSDVRVDWNGTYDLGWWDGSLSLVTALANGYVDIPTDTFFTPYVGAGIGFAWANVDQENESGVTFDLTAGAAVELTPRTKLDIGYRYMNVNADGSNLNEHQGLAGLRFGS